MTETAAPTSFSRARTRPTTTATRSCRQTPLSTATRRMRVSRRTWSVPIPNPATRAMTRARSTTSSITTPPSATAMRTYRTIDSMLSGAQLLMIFRWRLHPPVAAHLLNFRRKGHGWLSVPPARAARFQRSNLMTCLTATFPPSWWTSTVSRSWKTRGGCPTTRQLHT